MLQRFHTSLLLLSSSHSCSQIMSQQSRHLLVLLLELCWVLTCIACGFLPGGGDCLCAWLHERACLRLQADLKQWLPLLLLLLACCLLLALSIC